MKYITPIRKLRNNVLDCLHGRNLSKNFCAGLWDRVIDWVEECNLDVRVVWGHNLPSFVEIIDEIFKNHRLFL